MELLLHYFPNLTPWQQACFARLRELYGFWNEQINVISRKDIDNLYLHHVLHSLSIAQVCSFKPGTKVLDVGTGGGFPGIPLAILFPEASFTLVDSIGKKIKVVNEVAEALELKNVNAQNIRAEQLPGKFDFVVSRAVTELPAFLGWVWAKIIIGGNNALPNGVLYLKGGDLTAELDVARAQFRMSKGQITEYLISDYIGEPFYETKKIVYIQR